MPTAPCHPADPPLPTRPRPLRALARRSAVVLALARRSTAVLSLVLAACAAPPVPVALPRTSLQPADLGLLVAEGDALSEAAALAYQRARGIPEANVLRLPVPAGQDSISAADFARLKARIDAGLPPGVQATLVTWLQPSRVTGSAQGQTCSASITSALAFGWSPALCGGCRRTLASPYYDSETTQPWTALQIRPAMLLGAPTPAAAQALIDRGLAAEASTPAGSAWLVRTADAARSVRWRDQAATAAAFDGVPGITWQVRDASAPGTPQEVTGQTDLLFHFTGLATLAQIGSNRFLPGALADHLTSSAGHLPTGNGQTLATAWLAAGASASYGTVEEPCNHLEKFPRASVLLAHYLRGATAIEAYWKSVAWPGQGLFVGDPLARPWGHTPSAVIEGGAFVLHSGALRPGATYRLEWQAGTAQPWQLLDSLVPGAPQQRRWRVPLPAAAAAAAARGGLRLTGPCPVQPLQTCVLAGHGA